MKNTFAIILFCLILLGGLSSCTEEEVTPSNTPSNISGTDDWQKHNV